MDTVKAPEVAGSKHDFIGRFMIGSGGVLSSGAPIPEITLYLSVTGAPFVSIGVHITPEEAIQIGKALIEHGERMVVKP